MYVGIDVGKNRCRAAIMDKGGNIVNEFCFDNDHEGISYLSSILKMDDIVVMESTTYWSKIYDNLEDMYMQVRLANPLKTKAIASARIKKER